MKALELNNTTTFPVWKILLVLIGFPAISTLYSYLLINQNIFSGISDDFFVPFWIGVTIWYQVQIAVIYYLINGSGWSWKDIGYKLTTKGTVYTIIGYFLFAFGLVIFIEIALESLTLNQEKLDGLRNLIPKTTTRRIIFVIAGLTAGLSEEIVYRGFAINALKTLKINKWLAVVIAAIPFVLQHGLKAYGPEFWWFLGNGLVFGVIFVLTKRLLPVIIIHWLIILTALMGIFAAIEG